jgi:hypothetical protein
LSLARRSQIVRVASHQIEIISTHRKIGHFASIILPPPSPTQPHSTPRHVLVLLSSPAWLSNTAAGRACSRCWRPHRGLQGCEPPPTAALPRLVWASALGIACAASAASRCRRACGKRVRGGWPLLLPLLRPPAAGRRTPAPACRGGAREARPVHSRRKVRCGRSRLTRWRG